VTTPQTPNEVALALAKLSRDLDATVHALNTADADCVRKREDFTLAYARAFLRSEGPMEVRKQIATEQTTAERLAAETADQIVRGLRRQVDSLRVRIDVGRSYNAALRAEASLAGGAS
jgi:hypothetical protein